MISMPSILWESPHDKAYPENSMSCPDKQVAEDEAWVPSRFNVRAVTEDGGILLWNTLSGSMSLFKPGQAGRIKGLLARKGHGATGDPFAKYLYDRGFLVKQSSDELSKFRYYFGQQHYRDDVLQLILMSSEDCNFRCKYCYEKFARGTMLPWVRRGIKNFVEKKAGRLRNLSINWFGGEPLYGFKAIEDLAPFFKEQAEKNGLAFHSHMTTNGYLLTPDIVTKLFDWRISAFQITLDGLPENHNCNRPTREGGATFDTIFNNLVAMKERADNFHVGLRVNFDWENAPHMDRFLDMTSAAFGGDERFQLNFHRIGKWGGDRDDQLEVCGGKDGDAVLRDLKAEAKRRGLNIRTLKMSNRLGGEACYAARPYNFLINARGQVMKCTILLDTKPSNIVGQIDEEGGLDLDAERMALWTDPSFESDLQCQKCTVLPLCQGIHCPLVRIERGGRTCSSTRTNGKGDLLELLNSRKEKARIVKIPSEALQSMTV